MIETYRITGMDCADCAKTIQRGVSKLPGVVGCNLNFGNAVLSVEGDLPREKVVARVKELGYGVYDKHAASNTSQPAWRLLVLKLPETGIWGFVRFMALRTNTILAMVGAVLILPSLIFNELLPFLNVSGQWLTITALLSLAVAGVPIAQAALRSFVYSREITINMLMTIASIGAVIIGAYSEAGLVMVLFAIAEALEGYTTERARNSIQMLIEMAPNEATAKRACMDCKEHLGRDGYTGGPCPFCGVEEMRVMVEELVVGDTIIVKPGERVAMDGRVTKGESAINQAPITGESMPVNKRTGDIVYAGSINGEGAIEVYVTQLSKDNTLSRIIQMVESAQMHKAPAERFVDKFAKYYTPIVVGLAGVIAIVPPVLLGQAFWGDQGWLYRALALLVVACPCALVISTPVAIISAINNAARNGVLIKGGRYLEALAQVNAVAFDKTGTLTEGNPSVIKVHAINCTDTPMGNCENCANLLALTSAVERRSEHPLAKAIVAEAEAWKINVSTFAADDVRTIIGKGVIGRVNNSEIMIGSHSYFDQNVPHNLAECDEIAQAAGRGYTPMMIGQDGRYLGYITVADTIRKNSPQAIAALKTMGMRDIVMLSGDNAATANTIASEIGVTDVKADLLPDQKVETIKRLIQKHGHVAMVGDGINDAPALSVATVGIAMGAGTAQAMETADVALVSNDLTKLPFVLALARQAMRTIRNNIVFAIGIKIVFLILVLMGWGSLWLAVFADMGASLLVTFNGIRLLKFRSSE